MDLKIIYSLEKHMIEETRLYNNNVNYLNLYINKITRIPNY